MIIIWITQSLYSQLIYLHASHFTNNATHQLSKAFSFGNLALVMDILPLESITKLVLKSPQKEYFIRLTSERIENHLYILSFLHSVSQSEPQD